MKFSALVGHDRPVMILQRAISGDMLAHAYLFSGQTGIGKRTAALALAAAVNCRNAEPDGGCGACISCRNIEAMSHPDVHLLAPDGTEIKIDQIRQVQADLSLKPFGGMKKVLIVDGAESMNQAASNAFLKTLEEPPGDSLIVLVTAMPQSLLPTIRSRCQEIKFSPIPRGELARVLMLMRGLSETDAWFVAALVQGSLGRALEMDSDQERAARRDFAASWSNLETMDAAAVIVLADALAKDRERFDRFLDIGMEWLRDAAVFRETGNERLLVDAEMSGQYRQWGERQSLTDLLSNAELFAASRKQLDQRVSAQLVAENLLLTLARK